MKNKISFSFILLFLVLTKNMQAQKHVLADSLFLSGLWVEAGKEYEKYIEANPKDMPGYLWNRIGQCNFYLLQYDKAISAYKKAVVYNNNPNIMYNIACAYNKKSGKDSAFVWLNRSADAGLSFYEGLLKDQDLANLHEESDFKMILEKVKKNQKPCSAIQEAHQFDFWIGDWKVYNQLGTQVGSSKIEQILGECVIFENWSDSNGNKGKSFNMFNPSIGKWQQTWADDKGEIIEFINGEFKNNAMKFSTSRPQLVNGKNTYRRLTFFYTSPDEVRQLGEVSKDLEKTWNTEYDLKYIRVK